MPSRSALGVVGLLAACASSAPVQLGDAREPSQSVAAVVRPVPPSDLDVRLIQHYPLRGEVLGESGFARVRFTVRPSGAVAVAGEALKASHPAYAAACRGMLEASTWAPARDAQGDAVAYTGTFDCAFEHPSDAEARRTQGAVAKLPVQPEYGRDWYERLSDEGLARDAGAALIIEVDTDGRVRVVGISPGSHPAVAAACRDLIESGPRWQPAQDAAGKPVPFTSSYPCVVEVESKHMELVLGDVGVTGVRSVEVIANELASHLHAFSHCFESAVSMSKPVNGTHWLAFEITASGALGRVEWVERPLEDALLDECVRSAAAEQRFSPADGDTLVDIQLQVGGVSKIQLSL